MRQSTLYHQFLRIIEVTAAVGLIGLLIVTLLQAVMRTFFTVSLGPTLELSQYILMPAIVYLGLPIAFRDREHISAPMIFDRLSSRLQREFSVISFISFICTVFFVGMIGWYGLEQAIHSTQILETAGHTELSSWWIRYAIPFGALVSIVVLLVQAVGERSPENTKGEIDVDLTS